MKATLCLGLLLALAVATCQCRPAAQAPGTKGDPQQRPPSLVRRDWPQYLSQEQQHLLSQFLPHILTELNNHKGFVHEDKGIEALHDHYYPDWMDFGRRSAEDEAGAA
ncbi:ANTR protein, partial [Myiagra hebetior]|nr:ANTR protein [Myiagra hebetior]